ncbi:uncharacterized protein BDZ99DRAFT_153127 [Mytilinidion resinicola]|uniref:Uncharacterized protein n=1 Tax=Mytilinidion resinicola TaxID=574789 RepID=A0A6A6Y6N3_9PEZI|nr:uncharacterized protein BDZ99DRAFT_153127 [Mytilinidion resinicola]KAF2804481.1 hypothetical protein BDZ99DRAFT_153127 [Mytilinidion resinicola]
MGRGVAIRALIMKKGWVMRPNSLGLISAGVNCGVARRPEGGKGIPAAEGWNWKTVALARALISCSRQTPRRFASLRLPSATSGL